MLTELRIRNLAIVDEVDLLFSKGLNILTGETGAGKSIIINAVNMLFGDRSADELVRTGAEMAVAEALFDLSDHPQIEERLRAMGVVEPKELVIRRTVNPSGRNRAFVNGSLSTLSMVSKIGELLLSLYGQHEHQTLQKADKHIEILDEFGGLIPTRRQYEGTFREMEELRRELIRLREQESHYTKDRELMQFQSQEIGAARLREQEEEALREQRRILSNAERLFEWASGAERILYSDESSVTEKLDGALQRIREISKIDPSINGLNRTLESAFYQLEEVAHSLRDYRERVERDPQALETVDGRLDEIRRLKKKYGHTIGEILEFKERLDRQLETLDSSEQEILCLEKRMRDLEQRTASLARSLSGERKKVAVDFQKAMEEELSSLGMAKTVFEARFGGDRPAAREKWVEVEGLSVGPRGMDTLEFYISPNVGEEPRPMSRIASGGELSRIMLAIKRIIASAEPGQTLIFDEVDAGIGGAVAEVVGKKLRDLSLYHQVLCVTHLPQIACFADAHHSVTKTAQRNRTKTQVRELTVEERVDEIARMLGGIEITDKTRAHAAEMIEKTRKAIHVASSTVGCG